MRRLVTARDYDSLAAHGASFLFEHTRHGEVLLLASTRVAADDLVRLRLPRIAGVHRMTPGLLASALAANPLAERGLAPVNRLGVEALAARAVHRTLHRKRLAYFGDVASSPGFPRSLARTLYELRLEEVSDQALAATGDAGGDLAELHAAYRELLKESRLADYPAILRHAREVAAARTHRLAGLPVLFLDVPAHGTLPTRLFAELAEAAPAWTALTLADDERSIAAWRRMSPEAIRSEPDAATSLERFRTRMFSLEPLAERPLDRTIEIFSASGEGVEAIEIARRIHRLAALGVRFDRIAVLLRHPGRYQPLIEEAFHRAGIEAWFTHGSVRPDPAGRAFLALLACAAESLPATRFAEYLSLGQAPEIAPLKAMAAGAEGWLGTEDELLSRDPQPAGAEPWTEDAPAPATPAAWEKLIVDAAVVGGHDRWQRRLTGLENELLLRLNRLEEREPSRQSAIERQLEQLRTLKQLALPLIEMLAALPQSAAWAEWIEHLSALAEAGLTQPDSVLRALNELWSMGEVGPLRIEEVILVLEERLRFLRRPPARRRYGSVWVGSIDEARGLSFDVVFLPGLAEGLFPVRAVEDPLLLDEFRQAANSALTVQAGRIAEERLRLRIAAAAAKDTLIASYPTMDSAQNRARVPSFYAMEVVRAAEGRLPGIREFAERTAHGVEARLGWPAPDDTANAVDSLEYDLSWLRKVLEEPDEAPGTARYLFEASPFVGQSLRSQYWRRRPAWSTADGLLDTGEETRAIAAEYRLSRKAYSATTLQRLAACPYQFLLHGIHQLRPREEPVGIEQLDPLTRGSLFHEVQFMLFQRTGGDLKAMQQSLDAVFDEVAGRYAEELVPAIPRVWRSEMEDLRADLHGWIRHMENDARNWRAIHAELAFGLPTDGDRDPHSVPGAVPIVSGASLRGSIDWIEENARGELRVTDHKTGRRPQRLPRAVGGGQMLQPALYALAAEQILGKKVAESRLYYCTQRGNYSTHRVPLGQGTRETLAMALELIDEHIAQPNLPAAPRQRQCEWCDFQIVCGPFEERRAAQKAPLDKLAALRELE